MTPGDSELPQNWAGASPAWQKAPGLQPRPPASLPRPPCSVPRGQAPVLATAHSCGLLRPLQEWGSVSRVPDRLMGFCPQALPGPGTLWGWFWQILCSGIGPWPLLSCPAPSWWKGWRWPCSRALPSPAGSQLSPHACRALRCWTGWEAQPRVLLPPWASSAFCVFSGPCGAFGWGETQGRVRAAGPALGGGRAPPQPRPRLS